MEVLGFDANGSIILVLDGISYVVPNDAGNRHRQMIADWEQAGNTIPPYVPPEPNPYHDLKPYQFWGAVRATGNEQPLRDWVASISDPVQQALASAMLDFSLEFRRDHPLMEAARVELNMTEQELNDLWLWGLTL